MRLGTFNLMHGRSLHDGRVVAERLRAAVALLDPDVLGLQEVDRHQPRSGGADLTAEVAAAMGAAHHRFVATLYGTPGVDGRPGPPAAAGTACYGIGMASRWPVRCWHTTMLPAAAVAAPVFVPGPGGGLRWLRDEPRALLAAVVESPAGPLTVATTHLSFVPGWNVRQLHLVLRELGRLPGPRVLLGDLNLPAAAVTLVPGWRALARRPTYPAPMPRVQLDHVLTGRRGGVLPAVRRVETPAVGLSDHRPLVVELAG
ncbi:MAG TPA: endonuclease/exonuclease/phosphatase family protein [Micromonosporaceae bacterium]|nr:endonuclease/exonuclease/phosphatase family protein [Micromonosporaceae bacterium]